MKICALLVLCTIHLSTCEYPRLPPKIRGPPPPPRSPLSPPYYKKWQHHLQHHNVMHRPPQYRARPPAVHMHSSHFHKLPVGVVSSVPKLPPPLMPTTAKKPHFPPWLSPMGASSIASKPHFLHAGKPLLPSTKKPFYSSPAISAHLEYDYHIQNNAIPNPNHMIKQIGETGPIHTIPAPNLSLADKPIVVEEVIRHQQPSGVHPASYMQVGRGKSHNNYHHHHQQQRQQRPALSVHQYQVTESPEPYKPFIKYPNSHPAHFYQFHKLESVPASALIDSQPTTALLNDDTLLHSSAAIDTKELYHLLSAYPQHQQQQILDAFANMPAATVVQPVAAGQQSATGAGQISGQQQQEHYPAAATVIAQEALFQPDHNYLQQMQQQEAQHIGPQYHSFNYDEQSYQQQHQKGINRREFSTQTTTTSLPIPENHKIDNTVHTVHNALAQAQYIQNYFDTRKIVDSINNVEPDAKPSDSSSQKPNTITAEENIEGGVDEEEEATVQQNSQVSRLFATLPNKEAAETLATLQAAGRINSSLMEMTNLDDAAFIVSSDNTGSNDEYKNHEPIQDTEEDIMVPVENRAIVMESYGQRVSPKVK